MTAQVWLRGQHEFSRVRSEIDSNTGPFLLPMVRSLGTGAAITSFVIAPISLPRESQRAVTTLGALATLIVSAFDVVLDRGEFVPDLFAPPDSSEFREKDPKALVLRELVALYYRWLEELPQSRKGVRILIDRAIKNMYYAELKSANQCDVRRNIWWRKNVLPFAVMSLPAWLIASCDSPVRFRNHLTWVCRLGEFFGWLDDCVDYVDDSNSRRVNCIDRRLRSVSEPVLARSIAAQAGRVLAQWDSWNAPSDVRDIFTVLVWSWIENSPAAATT